MGNEESLFFVLLGFWMYKEPMYWVVVYIHCRKGERIPPFPVRVVCMDYTVFSRWCLRATERYSMDWVPLWGGGLFFMPSYLFIGFCWECHKMCGRWGLPREMKPRQIVNCKNPRPLLLFYIAWGSLSQTLFEYYQYWLPICQWGQAVEESQFQKQQLGACGKSQHISSTGKALDRQ